MRVANFLYKCRMCGTLKESPQAEEERALNILEHAARGQEIPGDSKFVPLLRVHRCTDSSAGLMDLVGYTVEH